MSDFQAADAWQRSRRFHFNGDFDLTPSRYCLEYYSGLKCDEQNCYAEASATVGTLSESEAWRCKGFQTLGMLGRCMAEAVFVWMQMEETSRVMVERNVA